MSKSVLYMSMSLDGYIAGPNDGPNKPGGDGFTRLHDWIGDSSRSPGATKELLDEINALPSRVELEIVRVINTPDATHIRYRIRR